MTTKEKIDQMIEVLIAYKEGKQIEVKNRIGEWIDIEEFGSLFNCSDFRFKPKVDIPEPSPLEDTLEGLMKTNIELMEELIKYLEAFQKGKK